MRQGAWYWKCQVAGLNLQCRALRRCFSPPETPTSAPPIPPQKGTQLPGSKAQGAGSGSRDLQRGLLPSRW